MMMVRTKVLYIFALVLVTGTNLLCMKPGKTKTKKMKYSGVVQASPYTKAAQEFIASFKAWQPHYRKGGLDLNGDLAKLKGRLEHCKELCQKTLEGSEDAKDLLLGTFLSSVYAKKAPLMPDLAREDIVTRFITVSFPRLCKVLSKNSTVTSMAPSDDPALVFYKRITVALGLTNAILCEIAKAS